MSKLKTIKLTDDEIQKALLQGCNCEKWAGYGHIMTWSLPNGSKREGEIIELFEINPNCPVHSNQKELIGREAAYQALKKAKDQADKYLESWMRHENPSPFFLHSINEQREWSELLEKAIEWMEEK